MFYTPLAKVSCQLRKKFTLLTFFGLALLAIVLSSCLMFAQDQGSQNPNQQPAPPEAGGPGNDVGPYAIPKKKEEPPPPPPTKPKKIEGMPDYSLKVDVPLVDLDVSVLTKNGQFVPGLKKENFRVYEDGVPQPISNLYQLLVPVRRPQRLLHLRQRLEKGRLGGGGLLRYAALHHGRLHAG